MAAKTFSKKELLALLLSNPDITIHQMMSILGCGQTTLYAEMSRHGLSTKTRGERTKLLLSKEALQSLLDTDPDTTVVRMAVILGVGKNTVTRELTRHGLRTKKWAERKHTTDTKGKISRQHIASGVSKGENNPNYGPKPRHWLEGENNSLRKWSREHPEFGENQRGAANPIHKVIHLYQDPTYVANITRGIRACTKARTGKSYEEVYGVDKAAEIKDKLRAASPARMAKFKRKVTEPELIVRGLLQKIGIEFVEQAPMGYHTVDFLIPELNIFVQADGDYWHANPRKYTDDKLSKNQRKQRRIDASCDSFIRNRGYVMVRLWEFDLHNHLDQCEQILRDHIRAAILNENQTQTDPHGL